MTVRASAVSLAVASQDLAKPEGLQRDNVITYEELLQRYLKPGELAEVG